MRGKEGVWLLVVMPFARLHHSFAVVHFNLMLLCNCAHQITFVSESYVLCIL